MLRRYIARIFGHGPPSPATLRFQAVYEAYKADLAADPPILVSGHDWLPHPERPYGGQSVPREALYEPDAEFLDFWHEEWLIAPGANEGEAVVFHHHFECERESGAVIYEQDSRRDERYPAQRLADTIAIHQRLGEGRDESGSPKRIVKFRGGSLSHYRIKIPSGGIWTFNKPDERDDVVLALYQRWVMQYLSACRYIHARGIVINAPVDESIWLRSDLSIVVAGFTAASCEELDIPAGFWANSSTLNSPFGPTDSQSTIPPFGVAECGELRADLFAWACWVYTLMTGRRSAVVSVTEAVEQHKYGSPMLDENGEERAREDAVRQGWSDDWPVLREEELGTCLVKAWRGQYESAEGALRDVRAVLEGCGRVMSEGEDDEIDGIKWEAEFEYDQTSMQISRSLRNKG
jgi:hypothetical protein